MNQKEFFLEYLRKQNLLYKKNNKEVGVLLKEGWVDQSYFLEKYGMTQEQINQFKPGRFDISTTHIQENKKVTYKDLVDELIEENNRERCSACTHKNCEDFASCRREEYIPIKDRLIGKNGIVSNLKKYLDLDLSLYEHESVSRNKLLKLLYKLEKNVEGKGKGGALKNVLLMLSKPSLENIDNSFVGFSTNNGNMFRNVKMEIAKEISNQFILKTRCAIPDVITKPEAALQSLLSYMNRYNSEQWVLDRYNIAEQTLKDLIKKITALPQNDMRAYSLFETFYLKLILSENIARENNLIAINHWVLKLKWKKPSYIDFSSMVINDDYTIEALVKSNIKIITCYIFGKDDCTVEEEKEICKAAEWCVKIFEFFKMNSTIVNFNLEYIIAAIQVYLKCKTEKIKYVHKYYGTNSTPKTLISVLKNTEIRNEAFEIVWINMVCYQYYSNRGYENVYRKFKEVEVLVSKLMICILLLTDMQIISKLTDESIAALDT